MKILTPLILAAALNPTVGAHDDLAGALAASPPPGHDRGDLPETAVQQVIDACRLGWTTEWRTGLFRGGVDVRAYVSADRRFCILTRAHWGEFGQYGSADYALVAADSGLIWLKPGTLTAPPAVSDRGAAALFQEMRQSDRTTGCTPVQLVLIDTAGDTLFARDWPEHVRRPLQHDQLEECYAFSPDGATFLTTMNSDTRDETNNTWLHVVDLAGRTERVEYLGPFDVRSLSTTPEGALLQGDWRVAFRIPGRFEEGFYRILWSPWRLEKVVTRVVTL
jgi:hypothetical protein